MTKFIVSGGIISLSAWLLSVSTGCSVLTQSQLNEVNNFAGASKGYAQLASQPIRDYGETLVVPRLFDITALDFTNNENTQVAKTALSQSILNDKLRILKQAKELSKHFTIIEDYSSILKALSSADLTTDLERQAEALGEAVDKNLVEINKLRKTKGDKELNLIGGSVAKAVSRVGTWFVHARQTVLVKTYVDEMDPNVETFMREIGAKYDEKVCKHFDQLTDKVWNGYLTKSQIKRFPSFFDSKVAFETMADIKTSKELCQGVKGKSDSFRKAHGDLKHALSKKATLKDGIMTVKQFVEEVADIREAIGQ